MKSIKPGRAGSAMGAFGSLFAIGIGVIWTLVAFELTSNKDFPLNLFWLFGVFFILAGVGNFVFNWKNTTGENRYSMYDVVDAEEESDPLNDMFGNKEKKRKSSTLNHTENEFCPYCGKHVEEAFEFCPKCGKTLAA